jgi:hypothetical protein
MTESAEGLYKKSSGHTNWAIVFSVNPYTLNPPESEVAFEKLCLALLKRHWSRPGLERFAKKGEEQFGVDIFDTLDPPFIWSSVRRHCV